mgnify:CR=1 FL=1
MNSTKRNIVISAILSLALCVSLIAGATFAIFTSESKVNIAVTSGKVDVVATINEDSVQTKQLGTEYTAGKTSTFAGAVEINGNSIDIKNFVPGDGVKFDINVTNHSNVAIKYRVVVSEATESNLADKLKIGVDGKEYFGSVLGDYIKLEAGAAIGSIPVSIELPENAGNDWQDKIVKFYVAVEAVQGNANTVQNPIVFTEDGEYNITGLRADGKSGVIRADSGTLTLVGNGQVVAEQNEGSENSIAVWANGGDIVIKGGSYTHADGVDPDNSLIYALKGTIKIYGGIFKAVDPRWTLNCQNAAYRDKTANIVVMGGKFYKFDPSNLNVDDGTSYVAAGYKVVQNGDWYEVVVDTNSDAALDEVFAHDNVDFGFGSTSTEAVELDGNGVYVGKWVDAWVNSDTTIRNVVFKNGAVFSAKANNVTVTLENCTFYACDQSKLTYTGNNSLTNSGAGMCLNLEKSSHTGIKFVVKNCTFIGENDNTLSAEGPRYNGDGTLNGMKKRGHAIAIDAICGGGEGTLDSLLIEGCVIDGVRGNAIQLYGTTGDITIKDTKINSWAVNNTGIGYAIRGDFAANGSRTLTLSNVYFGLDEIAGNTEFGHVKVGSFSGNTDGKRTAGTY